MVYHKLYTTIGIIRRCNTLLIEVIGKDEKECKKHDSKASGYTDPSHPCMWFVLVICGFFIVSVINFADCVRKFPGIHKDTSLSIKYFLIFWRMRESRTDTFFSDIPTRLAISL